MNLNEDVFFVILLHLNLDDLIHLYMTNKMIYKIVHHKHFWYEKFKLNDLPLLNHFITPIEWVDEYRKVQDIKKQIYILLQKPYLNMCLILNQNDDITKILNVKNNINNKVLYIDVLNVNMIMLVYYVKDDDGYTIESLNHLITYMQLNDILFKFIYYYPYNDIVNLQGQSYI